MQNKLNKLGGKVFGSLEKSYRLGDILEEYLTRRSRLDVGQKTNR